jgi:nucleoside-diphosphate-sugar epimerase
MTRSVLVTGAGGFVGSHLAEGFSALGYRVVALDQAFDAPTRERLAGARLLATSLTPEALAGVDRVDVVVHGAAITTPPVEFGLSDAGHVAANMDLLRISLQWGLARGVEQFVFLSSSGVFSARDGGAVQLESASPTSTEPYALAKRAGEDAVTAAASRLQAIAVRLGPIYGPHEAPRGTRTTVSQVRRWLDRAEAGKAIVVHQPEERRDWTFAPDLAGALHRLLAITPPVTGVVHLCSGQILSNLELAQAIADLVADARLVVEPETGAASRRPMGSDRLDLASLGPWTDLATGLAMARNREAVA